MAGKRISPKKCHWAPFVVILAVAAMVATIGGTMAWLTAKSEKDLVNTFEPANVEIKVTETYTNNVKSNVSVENKSDVPVYVRATVVVNWVDPNNTVCAGAHTGSFDFTWPSTWSKGADGYYYYNGPVEVGATANIIDESGVALKYDGDCKMQVTFLAQAIQAEPDDAVKYAWGFVPGSN